MPARRSVRFLATTRNLRSAAASAVNPRLYNAIRTATPQIGGVCFEASTTPRSAPERRPVPPRRPTGPAGASGIAGATLFRSFPAAPARVRPPS